MGRRSTTRWTEAEDALIRERYADSPQSVLLATLPGRTEDAIKQRAAGMGIRKTAEYRQQASRLALARAREAGKIRSELCRRPIGSVHEKGRYLLIKVAQPDVWRPVHIHAWELAHGPVPEGMIVAAKDGNTRNTDLANLCLRTLAENQLRRNRYNKDLPEEIVDILHLQNEIKKEIKRKTKHEK